MDVRSIGGALGAAMLIEGSVRRQGDRVRVAAQLTQVATGVHLWSGMMERKVSDVWAVQEEIARAVVDGVHVELTSGEQRRIARRHTANSDAFELYLRGCHALDRSDLRSQREALGLFERAAAADPEYALPLLGIARSNKNLVMLGAAPPRDIVPHAKIALNKALALDPEFAEAHSLLASLIARHEWDWATADHHHRMALRLAPNTAEVHDEYATSYLAPRGRIEEALAENRIARQLDPLSATLARSYVLILILGRRLCDAEREAKTILSQRPNDGFVRVFLALALHGQRRLAEALVEYKRVYEDDPSIQHEAFVADVLARLGDAEPARQLLERLRDLSGREFVPAMVIAWLHVHLGEKESAVAAIEQACENREYELLFARTGYGFDWVRDHPRFRAVVDRLGFDYRPVSAALSAVHWSETSCRCHARAWTFIP
jgi:tetratricopeptide (TPR) repeat protein